MLKTVKAICLNATDYRESDKLLVLLCPEIGKLVSRIRSVKSPKSKLKAGASPNCYAEYTLQNGSGLYVVTGVEVIDQFFNTWVDPEKNLAAAAVTEALELFTTEGVEAEKEFMSGLKALFGINYGEAHPYIYLLRFMTGLLREIGTDPDTFVIPGHVGSLISAAEHADEEELACLDFSRAELVAAILWLERLFKREGGELKTLKLLKG